MPAPTVSLPDIRTARARFLYGGLALTATAAFVLLALRDRAPNAFHAHGYCYLWQPPLVGLLVVCDLSIWLSSTGPQGRQIYGSPSDCHGPRPGLTSLGRRA